MDPLDWGQSRIEKWLKTALIVYFPTPTYLGVPITLFVIVKLKRYPDSVSLMERSQSYWTTRHSSFGDLDAAELLGDEAEQYRKVTDTLDVWFDSGSTFSSVVAARPEFHGHGVDLYLKVATNIAAGLCHLWWFQPQWMAKLYKQVLTHGFTVDGKGRKMSKSIGNVIAPQTVNQQIRRRYSAFMGCGNRLQRWDDGFWRNLKSQRRCLSSYSVTLPVSY